MTVDSSRGEIEDQRDSQATHSDTIDLKLPSSDSRIMPIISTIIIYKAINAKPQKRQHFNKRDHRSTNASNTMTKLVH